MPLASLLRLDDFGVHRVGDTPIGFACRVLVDQRGPDAVVSHPLHEVAEAGRSSVVARQMVTGVPQIMKMQFRYADGFYWPRTIGSSGGSCFAARCRLWCP